MKKSRKTNRKILSTLTKHIYPYSIYGMFGTTLIAIIIKIITE